MMEVLAGLFFGGIFVGFAYRFWYLPRRRD
jgi:nucleoside recognition membrane protein YjiH